MTSLVSPGENECVFSDGRDSETTTRRFLSTVARLAAECRATVQQPVVDGAAASDTLSWMGRSGGCVV